MKKFVTLILSLSLCFSVVACSSGSDSSSGSSSSESYIDEGGDYSSSSSDSKGNIEIIQDGDTLTLILTGSLVTDGNEMIENGEEGQVSVQFNDVDGEFLGSFTLISTVDGNVYKSYYDAASEQSFDMSISYNSEKIVYTCSDCAIDIDQVGQVSAYTYANEVFGSDIMFNIDEISVTQGVYEAESSDGTDEYEASGIYIADIDTGYGDCELISTEFGYTLVYDGNTYALEDDPSHDAGDAISLWGTSAENSELRAYVTLVVGESDPYIYLELQDSSSQLFSASFKLFTALTYEYYAYIDGVKTEDVVDIEYENSAVKLTVLGKYETDWIELTSENLYGTNLYLSDIPATSTQGDDSEYAITYRNNIYTDIDDNVSCNSAVLYVYKDSWYKIENIALISYYDTDFEEYDLTKDLYLNSFEFSSTGETIEITENEIIYNGETLAEVDIDVLLQTISILDCYPIYVDGVYTYEFRFYFYDYDDTEVSINIDNCIDSSYLTSGTYTVK